MFKHKTAALISEPDPEFSNDHIISEIILNEWNDYITGISNFFPIKKYQNFVFFHAINFANTFYKKVNNNSTLEDALESALELDFKQIIYTHTNPAVQSFFQLIVNTTYSAILTKFVIKPLFLIDGDVTDFISKTQLILNNCFHDSNNLILVITSNILELILDNLQSILPYETNNNDNNIYKINLQTMINIFDIIEKETIKSSNTIILQDSGFSYLSIIEEIYNSGWTIYTWRKILDGTFDPAIVYQFLDSTIYKMSYEVVTLFQILDPNFHTEYSPQNLVNNIIAKNKNINIYPWNPNIDPVSFEQDLIYLTLRNIAREEAKPGGTAWWLVKNIQPKTYPFGSDPDDKQKITEHLELLEFLLKKQDESGDRDHFKMAKHIQNTYKLFKDRIKKHKTAAAILPTEPDPEVSDRRTMSEIILEDWAQYIQNNTNNFSIEKYEQFSFYDALYFAYNFFHEIKNNIQDLRSALHFALEFDYERIPYQNSNQNAKKFLSMLVSTTYSAILTKFIVNPLCKIKGSIVDFILEKQKILNSFGGEIYNSIFLHTRSILKEILENIDNIPPYEQNNNSKSLYKINIMTMSEIFYFDTDPTDIVGISWISNFEETYNFYWVIYTWRKILDGTFDPIVINDFIENMDEMTDQVLTLSLIIDPGIQTEYSPQNLINNIIAKNKNIISYPDSYDDTNRAQDLMYYRLRKIAEKEAKPSGTAWWLAENIQPQTYPFGSNPEDKKKILKHLKLLKQLLEKQDESGDSDNFETAKHIQNTYKLFKNRLYDLVN